jgi:hypothetical protein
LTGLSVIEGLRLGDIAKLRPLCTSADVAGVTETIAVDLHPGFGADLPLLMNHAGRDERQRRARLREKAEGRRQAPAF